MTQSEKVEDRFARMDREVAQTLQVRYLHLNLLAGVGIADIIPRITLNDIALESGLTVSRVTQIINDDVGHMAALCARRDIILQESTLVREDYIERTRVARQRRFSR
jgi:hypothetical protein